jgi:hypothetical protein
MENHVVSEWSPDGFSTDLFGVVKTEAVFDAE